MLYTYAQQIEKHVKHNDTITLKDLLTITGENSLLVVLIFLSVFNIILSPLPMNSIVMGIPLFILSGLYLFKVDISQKDYKFLHKEHSCIKWRKYIERLTPYIMKFENWSNSRWHKVLTLENRILTGVSLTAMAFIILLPIPFANIPGSIGIIFVALGILQKDGLFVLGGYGIFALHIWGVFMLQYITN